MSKMEENDADKTKVRKSYENEEETEIEDETQLDENDYELYNDDEELVEQQAYPDNKDYDWNEAQDSAAEYGQYGYQENEVLGEFDVLPPRDLISPEQSVLSVPSKEEFVTTDENEQRKSSSGSSKSPTKSGSPEADFDFTKGFLPVSMYDEENVEYKWPDYNVKDGEGNEWAGEGYQVLYKSDEVLGEYYGVRGEYSETSITPSSVGSSVLAFGTEALEEALRALESPPPPRKESEEEIRELYMETVPPESEILRRRVSLEAANLPIKESTPSPPGTPKKVLRRMHECPSVESVLKLGELVRIHFNVLPGQRIFTVDARMDRTVLDIKKEISPICKVPAEYLILRKNRHLVLDFKTLHDLGAKPRRKMKFTVEISKRCPEQYMLKIPQEIPMKKERTEVRKVVVQKGRNVKTVQLIVEYPTESKQFIGGYHDKRTNIFYHHATTQTPFNPVAYPENVSHSACQTFHDHSKSVQTLVDNYVQTRRPDYYISSMEQKIITPKVYVTAEQFEQNRIKAAIVLQKYWRSWQAKRERASRFRSLMEQIELAEKTEKEITESRIEKEEDEMWRRSHPTRMVDVKLLVRAINEWKQKEVEYVNAHRWGADRKAALAEIMEKEADLLLDLERTKSTIRKNMHDTYVERIFHKMGDPKRIFNKNGNLVLIDNMDKHKMRHYHKLYALLKEPVADIEQRLAILEKIRDITKTYNSRITKFLASLIDREIDLMEFKAGPRLMVGLRQRILNLFYHLLRDPGFNPEARQLQKVSFETEKLRKDISGKAGRKKLQYH